MLFFSLPHRVTEYLQIKFETEGRERRFFFKFKYKNCIIRVRLEVECKVVEKPGRVNYVKFKGRPVHRDYRRKG